MVDAWRWIYFMPMAMRPIQRWFLDAAWTGGAIRSPEYAFTWTPPAWPYVNPTDDIAAIKEAVRGGLCSLSEAIRGRGDDPVAVFEEIERERKSLAEKGVVVDTDAGTTPKTGGATSAPAEPAPRQPSRRGPPQHAPQHALSEAASMAARVHRHEHPRRLGAVDGREVRLEPLGERRAREERSAVEALRHHVRVGEQRGRVGVDELRQRRR
jgi:hypothetical protein